MKTHFTCENLKRYHSPEVNGRHHSYSKISIYPNIEIPIEALKVYLASVILNTQFIPDNAGTLIVKSTEKFIIENEYVIVRKSGGQRVI